MAASEARCMISTLHCTCMLSGECHQGSLALYAVCRLCRPLLYRSVLEDLKLRWETKLEASNVYCAEEGVVDGDGKEYAVNFIALHAAVCPLLPS
jgi:hypothetical protein